VAALGHGHQFAAGRGAVEGLAGVPGAAHFLGLALQVAARHVQAHSVAVDVFERGRCSDVRAAGLQCDHQFDFVVHVVRQRGVRELAAVGHDGAGRFHEEERRFAVGVVAHLAGVFGVVAADAENAVDREARAFSLDGQRVHRCGGNGVLGFGG
jgi:hypothetical protein